jgi:hypothetical protein
MMIRHILIVRPNGLPNPRVVSVSERHVETAAETGFQFLE